MASGPKDDDEDSQLNERESAEQRGEEQRRRDESGEWDEDKQRPEEW